MHIGIDLGSRNVKMAIKEDGELKFLLFDTVSFYRKYGKLVDGELVVDFSAIGLKEIAKIVSTGYGRQAVKIKGGEEIPEIRAHALGAVYQTGLLDFTLLDLGGQDSKVVLVRKGKLIDFLTNDKCAASTGRYLENMASVLKISLDELGNFYENPVELSSTCAIFGETELLGKVVEGYSLEQLAAGVNYTIFKRIAPMLKKLFSPKVVFTGGVAYSRALKHIIEKELEVEVVIPREPQFNGAIGCLKYGGGL
ncbi:acyl-CoA dehydratase activase [Carboxydothermus pertinax]|uniref:Putative CoA-substrate-specific enzyme activase n=1 Tax=Carboxydothermus pertinax TaxID=870242 RepID=A0A1L8CRX6_9THEO|nr:acyl-CoA dehydratase activase [Carboxydothermus pertinax]GAV21647.1 putative CoA-substrate-specific enzyme activase [Carboxydothermus pertinax]